MTPVSIGTRPAAASARTPQAALPDIVIVNDASYVNGGSSHVALLSAVALARAGHSVIVFTALEPIMHELTTEPNLRVVCTGQRDILSDPSRLRAAAQGIWNTEAASAFERLIDSLDATRTIVHFHGWTKALSTSVVSVAVRRGFRVVVTLHEYFVACPLGSFYNHRKGSICRLAPLGPNCIVENCDPRSYRDKLWRVARQAVQRSVAGVPSGIRHFITISDFSESIMAPLLPSGARLHRVTNPISVERVEPAPVAANTAFTYVGRLSPEKGAALFARAAAELDLPAVFVGDGECAGEVRKLNPKAEITGWLPREAVNERLLAARALVFPSLWYETAGLVVSEAAALGVPSISADTCAAKERVAHGLTGLHFRGGDAVSLTQAMRLLTDARLAATLGREAYRRYWETPEDMKRHLSELTRVYEAMLHEDCPVRR